MRIAYICQPYPPMISGGALRVQQLAEGMARRGHSVLVIAASDRREAYTESTGGLRIVRPRSFRNPTRVGQYFMIWPQRAIDAELRTFRPDVIHLQDPFNIGLCAQPIARALGIPLVFTLHALPWFISAYAPPLPGLRQRIEAGLWQYAKSMHHKCDVFIVPSHIIATIVSQNINYRPKVISNGVDLNRFRPQPTRPRESETLSQAYGLTPHLPVILCVGRIDADRQVDIIIHAAARAMEKQDAQLLIVGDGRRRTAMIQLSEELGIRERAHFPGFVPADGDLPGLFRLASVFATASEIEVQSSATLEAAATGLPIVTVHASSMSEIVEDGVTGYLVPAGDIDSMAEKMISLLQEPDQARAMGEAGRALVQKHSLVATIDAHELLYRSLHA